MAHLESQCSMLRTNIWKLFQEAGLMEEKMKLREYSIYYKSVSKNQEAIFSIWWKVPRFCYSEHVSRDLFLWIAVLSVNLPFVGSRVQWILFLWWDGVTFSKLHHEPSLASIWILLVCNLRFGFYLCLVTYAETNFLRFCLNFRMLLLDSQTHDSKWKAKMKLSRAPAQSMRPHGTTISDKSYRLFLQ